MNELIDSRQVERQLVGFLFNPTLRADTLRQVTSTEIHDFDLQRIYSAVEQAHAAGALIDAVTIGHKSGVSSGVIDGYRHSAPMVLSPNAHAEILRGYNTCRDALQVADDLARIARDGNPEHVLGLIEALPTKFATARQTVEPGVDALDLVGRTYEHRWLVPGLLERTDRVMFVGGEGSGKSLLLRQFGVMCAAGIHPWKRTRIAPLRVLVVDLENSEPQISRSLGRLVKQSDLQHGRLIFKIRPQGMDLTSRHDVRWLDELMRIHAPDILVIGSLYKAYAASEGRGKASEEAAELVARAFDELRVRHDCAVLLEAHAPHGDGDRAGWRPAGSSLWLRWPEAGFGMKPIPGTADVDLVQWRGLRDRDRTVEWPISLVRGNVWPWEAVFR